MFTRQDKVIERILAAEQQAEAKAAAQLPVDPIQQTVTETIKDGNRRRAVDRDQAKVCIKFLGQPMGKSLHGKLRVRYDEWGRNKDDNQLVEAVHALAGQFGKEKAPMVPIQRLSREDLELICFEYVSS